MLQPKTNTFTKCLAVTFCQSWKMMQFYSRNCVQWHCHALLSVNLCEVLSVTHINLITYPNKIRLVYMQIRLTAWEELLVH